MPDILIRGIKKPERCFICPLKYNRGMNYYCTIKEMQGVDSCISKNTMSVVCPFSELPPHEDLIDIRTVLEIVMQYVPDDDGSCSKANADLRELLDTIENAPVVIPAERRESHD